MSIVRYALALLLALSFLVDGAAAERRVALVVGNSAYVHANALPNPLNDANDIAAALKDVGFEVILGVDLDKRAFDGKIREFARALEAADVALFFYAGHGLQAAGRNYLVPVDAQLNTERDLDFEGVSADFILKQMEIDREGKTNIVFLDACRDNPLARNLARSMGTRSASVGAGLAQVQTGVGTFIAYSTQPGNVAADGQGRNSPFTTALAKHIRAPDRNLTATMIEVRRDVLATTGGKQVPWDHSALTGDFYFQLASGAGALPGAKPSAPSDGAAVAARLRALEEELKKKSDPEQTQKMVSLAQSRERLRQLEDANKADQQRIFDLQYNSTRRAGAPSGADLSMDIGRIQMQIARRGQEMRKLREDIARLEGELGLAKAAQ